MNSWNVISILNVIFLLTIHYFTLSLARGGSFFRDYEYPELQLLLTAKEESNNSKEEENDSPRLQVKAVKGDSFGAQNEASRVYDILSPKNVNTETRDKPWMKSRYMETNTFPSKPQLALKTKLDRGRLYSDSDSSHEENAAEKEQQSVVSVESQNPVHSTSVESTGKNINNLTVSKSQESYIERNEQTRSSSERERGGASDESNRELSGTNEEPFRTKLQSNEAYTSHGMNNVNTSNDKYDSQSQKISSNIDRNKLSRNNDSKMPKISKVKHTDEEDDAAEDSAKAGLNFDKNYGRNAPIQDTSKEHVSKNAPGNKYLGKGVQRRNFSSAKGMNGDLRSQYKATRKQESKGASYVDTTNSFVEDQESGFDRRSFDTNYLREIDTESRESKPSDSLLTLFNKGSESLDSTSVEKYGVNTQGGYNRLVGSVGPRDLSNAENPSPNDGKEGMSNSVFQDPPPQQRVDLIRPPSISNDSQSNNAVPLTYPIPEPSEKILKTPKLMKGDVLSDIVARPPVKIVAHSEQKTGKSANSLPLPEKTNPLVSSADVVEESQRKDVGVNIASSESSLNINENYVSQASEIAAQQKNPSLNKPLPIVENTRINNKAVFTDSNSEHVLLKKSLTENKRNTSQYGLNENEREMPKIQENNDDNMFYSLTSKDAPVAKLSTFYYKVKDKSNLINMIGSKKSNRTKIGLKRSVGKLDSTYSNDDDYPNSNSGPPNQQDDEYDEDYEYDNSRSLSNEDPKIKSKNDLKRLRQKQDELDDYYFYVDQSSNRSATNNKKPASSVLVSKYYDDVFAHPLTLDDPELEIIHSERINGKNAHHKKSPFLTKRHKTMIADSFRENGYKNFYPEHQKRPMHPLFSHFHSSKTDGGEVEINPVHRRKVKAVHPIGINNWGKAK